MRIWFDSQPILSAIPNTDEMYLVEDWYFYIDGKKIWIPKGYYFNGASIPRMFWWIIGSPFEPCLQAAALAHDYIYMTHIYSRQIADEVLFQLCRQNVVAMWRSRTIWGSVRAFGAIPYMNDESEKTELNDLKTMISKRDDADKFEMIRMVA